MFDCLIDALLDSLKILIFIFIANVIIGFFESRINHEIDKSKHWSPILGTLFGLLPQCGFSVISTDLYKKKHITMGTLIAVYISTSDEAVPVLIANPDRIVDLLLLLLVKIVLGISVGYLVDLIFKNRNEEMHQHIEHDCDHQDEVHIGCCHHEIENESKLHSFLIHPLIHSLKIFLYVLVINVIFSLLIYYIGEENIYNFILFNKYLSPLLTVVIGLIPNCASSILIVNLFVLNQINFGALVAGLVVNAGLGVMVLLKDRKEIKNSLLILSILIITALVSGYLLMFIGL